MNIKKHTIDEVVGNEVLFSNYFLKSNFKFVKYYGASGDFSTPIYKINDVFVMFEKVNSKQFRIHPAYVEVYEEMRRKENETKS